MRRLLNVILFPTIVIFVFIFMPSLIFIGVGSIFSHCFHLSLANSSFICIGATSITFFAIHSKIGDTWRLKNTAEEEPRSRKTKITLV